VLVLAEITGNLFLSSSSKSMPKTDPRYTPTLCQRVVRAGGKKRKTVNRPAVEKRFGREIRKAGREKEGKPRKGRVPGARTIKIECKLKTGDYKLRPEGPGLVPAE